MFKFLGLIFFVLLFAGAAVNMCTGTLSPEIPYDARQGVDPDWPKKRDEYLANFCSENPHTNYCLGQNGL